MSALDTLLRENAESLGFDLYGVAPVHRAGHEAVLRTWLDDGMHGEMGWLSNQVEERVDPERLIPGARSVVVVGMSYHRPEHSGCPVARYALGRDYHNVMRRRLRQLRKRYLDLVGEPDGAWISVDSGPALERYWAWQAGLGWIGKSSNLVTLSHSSWVLLGVMVVRAELTPGAPHPEQCGTCSDCRRACPTDAIVADGIVDARRCISYLTIELSGAIPRDLRVGVGTHLFGCDICQDVCPYDRFAPGAPNPALGKRPDIDQLDARWILAMSDDELAARIVGSPLARPGVEGLRRNAFVVLGNSAPEAGDGALFDAGLADAHPLVRQHALWALARHGRLDAVAAHRRVETDDAVLTEIDALLTDPPQSVDAGPSV